MYCKHLKIKLNKTLECKKQNKIINIKECSNCKYRDYEEKETKKSINKTYIKKTPIKKVSKKRVTVSKKTYDIVLERDKCCCLCGSYNYLELHHINGRSKEKTNNVDNCVMLCNNCHHNVVHKNNKKWRKILNERNLEKYKKL